MKLKKYNRRIPRAFLFLALLALLSLCLLANATYAWLSTYWDSDQTKVDFTAGDVGHPTLHMWMFDTKEEGSASDTGQWVEKTVTRKDYQNQIPAAGDTETGTFLAKDIHLGTVDNLVTPKKDNIVYFRLDVTEDVGSHCELTVNLSEEDYGFTIYQATENPTIYTALDKAANPTIYDTMKLILSDKHVLDISYCVSTNDLTPNDADFDTLVFDSVCNIPENAENYYIYIKITPDLNTIAAISKDLYQYMPCVILFDLEIYYEIYTPVTG